MAKTGTIGQVSTALFLKLLATFVVTWVVFSLFGGKALFWSFSLAVLIGVINYVVGDFIVLNLYGNRVTSVVDGLIGIIIYYLMLLLIAPEVRVGTGTLMVFGLLIAVMEYFFHRYLVQTGIVALFQKRNANR